MTPGYGTSVHNMVHPQSTRNSKYFENFSFHSFVLPGFESALASLIHALRYTLYNALETISISTVNDCSDRFDQIYLRRNFVFFDSSTGQICTCLYSYL
ncbi:hypothetical protein X777_03957 [Ooceraea biroi]|uniref:Uncharacterized protein n=1 Tax=Ooceraea biroi TaxID=2015173 RepID=A0A026WIA6_OOCBI|nr:hypothetical protein X777_03957 [Ooceraea biroi]